MCGFVAAGGVCLLPGVVRGGLLRRREPGEVRWLLQGDHLWRDGQAPHPRRCREMGVSAGREGPGVRLLLRGSVLFTVVGI